MTIVYLGLPQHWTPLIFNGWNWDEHPVCALQTFAVIDSWHRMKTAHIRGEHMGEKIIGPLRFNRLMLDSGAFSAWQRGAVIDEDALIREQLSGEWDESVALDVIGDSEASVRGFERAQEKGSPAMPVFHYGDPWEHLDFYASRTWKVGLSCRFGESLKDSYRWLDQCFARIWPKATHSFGLMSFDAMNRYPFHSADATSWYLPVIRFGASASPCGKMRAGGGGDTRSRLNQVRSSIYKFLEWESFFASKWRKELLKCGTPESFSARQSTPPPAN